MINIGIISDFEKDFMPHLATVEALKHSGDKLGINVGVKWIATESLKESTKVINTFDGIWISPGKLYKSVKGAVNGIQVARESNIPTFGTCRGFQHLMIEFGRNVLGLSGNEIKNNDPFHSKIVLMRKECSLDDKWIDIKIQADSIAGVSYPKLSISEQDVCSFEISEDYYEEIEAKGLIIQGIDTVRYSARC